YNIENRLASPSNTWRGKFKWSGQTIIAPRLSVVSKGLMLSDHRYLEDLYIPSYESPFSISTPPYFADAKFKLHLDGENFSAGLGASFVDHILPPRRYSGYQLPLNLKLQSRLIPIARRFTPVPLYGQLAIEHRRIELYHPPPFDQTLPEDTRQQRLGG